MLTILICPSALIFEKQILQKNNLCQILGKIGFCKEGA